MPSQLILLTRGFAWWLAFQGHQPPSPQLLAVNLAAIGVDLASHAVRDAVLAECVVLPTEPVS